MGKLLFLAHRIPFPPNKGDKIRSYHLLRHLARNHRIFLGSFVDNPRDWTYQSDVARLCEEVFLCPLNPRMATLRSAKGLLNGEALTLHYYRDRAVQRWVDGVARRQTLDATVIYSSSMAQYVDHARFAGCRRVIDFVDVDSAKWREYARTRRAPLGSIYGRESRKLLEYERHIAARFDVSLFVTADEAELFRRLAPEAAPRVRHYENGVDNAYFDPDLPCDSPYATSGPVVVFTGAMDYWANVDGVVWFARDVFPHIRRRRPDAQFYIVGGRPAPAVRALAELAGISVTGQVPDVRPFLRHAAVAVAPLRIGRGIQNKVLEALAMAKPVVCTPAAAEGLQPAAWLTPYTQEAAPDFAAAVLQALEHPRNDTGRSYVLQHYIWDRHLARVDESLAVQ